MHSNLLQLGTTSLFLNYIFYKLLANNLPYFSFKKRKKTLLTKHKFWFFSHELLHLINEEEFRLQSPAAQLLILKYFFVSLYPFLASPQAPLDVVFGSQFNGQQNNGWDAALKTFDLNPLHNQDQPNLSLTLL